MKNIVILNGSNNRNGNTAKLVGAFTQGAQAGGSTVREFAVSRMNIKGCLGCLRCMGGEQLCVQKDDMETLYAAISEADVIVFASPIYWWGITGQLKTAVDRLLALNGSLGTQFWQERSTALILSSKGGGSKAVTAWYSLFRELLGCKDLGIIDSFEAEKTEEARLLGKSIS